MNDLSPFTRREMPHSIEVEQGVLGALLINNASLDKINGLLGPEHFYDPLHAEIYALIKRTIESGRLASPVTLKAAFDGSAEIVPANGDPPLSVADYLGRLAVVGTASRQLRGFALTVRDHFAMRELISLGEGLVAAAHEAVANGTKSETLIEQAQASFDTLRVQGRNERGVTTLYQARARAIDQINAAYMSGTGMVGLPTGIGALDKAIGGFAPGNLIVLGARPAMGKSALAAAIGLNVARSGAGLAFYSLEMSQEEIATRSLAAPSGLDSERLRRGQIDGDADMRRLLEAHEADRAAAEAFFIDESAGMTLAQLATRARALCRQHKVGLIMVDYLQIMGGSETRRHPNRVQEITEITIGLKALAKELNRPVLMLSQLNREVEKSGGTKRDEEDIALKRPQLSHLKDSGSIEQDADIVMFLHRPEYYFAKKKPDEDAQQDVITTWKREMAAIAGKAEVIIAKHRHGQTGIITLHFDASRMTFTDRG